MKMTIAKKLTTIAVANLTLMVSVSIIACSTSLQSTRTTEGVIDMLYKMERVDQMQFATVESIKMNDFVISGDLDKKTAFELSLLAVEQAITDTAQREFSLTERNTIAQIGQKFNLLSKKTDQICEEAKTSGKGFFSPSMNGLVEEADVIAGFIVETSEEFHNVLEKELAQIQRQSESVKNVNLATTATSLLVALALGIGGSIMLIRSITTPTKILARAAKIIANGNFGEKVDITGHDEIGQLAVAFNDMSDAIQERDSALVEAKENLEAKAIEREQAQKELRALNHELTSTADSLQKINGELKDFVYIASHDLREPLRKISAFGGLLKGSLEGKLDDDDKENFDFMIDGSDRMTQMIEGLLTYSRLNSKQTFEVVDLNNILQQIQHLELAAILEETNGVIEVPEPLPNVQANATQMCQLMQNLIANAVKYHSQNVAPKIVVRSKQLGNGRVRIEVQDNGIGIKAELQGEVFRMFNRLHSRREYTGAGIGLAVCKKIVNRHGGEIGVDSQEGEGSTFWLTLSMAEEPVVVS